MFFWKNKKQYVPDTSFFHELWVKYTGWRHCNAEHLVITHPQTMFVGGGGVILFSGCWSIDTSITCWFLLLILLNNMRNLFIFCINVDIDEMLQSHNNKGLGINSFKSYFPLLFLKQ